MLISALLAGCQPDKPSMVTDRGWVTNPLTSWSMWQLAERLDLTVLNCSSSSATLTNSANTVVLFPGPGARVFVNGQAVDVGDSIAAVGDTLFVPMGIDRQIRPLLRQHATEAMEPQPYQESPFKATKVSGRVMIDPGHGGNDPGAIGVTGLKEKNVTLDTALMLAEILEERGVDTRMTRKDDTFIPLNDRAEMANNIDAGLFVSIHADSSRSPLAEGFTVFVARGASKSSVSAATAIKKHLAPVVEKDRGIQQSNFRVLVCTNMPAVLIELGFLSNHEGAGKLGDKNYRRRLAEAIADGIVDYLQAN